MMPNDVDPSLCAAEPLLESLEDGFSPPAPAPEAPAAAAEAEADQPPERALGTKSLF